jgi:transposase
MGFRGKISSSTLSDANEQRNWMIYAGLAQSLIKEARKLYCDEDFGLQLEETVYALDSTIISLCLSIFSWAKFRKTKAAIKLHTLLDLQGNIPSFIHITDGKVNDVNVLNVLPIEPGAIYVMDRGYIDFERLYRICQNGAFFIVRAKKNLKFRAVCSYQPDRAKGVFHDQSIILTCNKTQNHYPDRLRRIVYKDKDTGKRFVFLTNNTQLPPKVIADLYHCRWQIELFFKWIKQHLRIKKIYGTSENAVKTQVWIAICVYVLVAIVKKRLNLNSTLYETLQILSITPFVQTPLIELLSKTVPKLNEGESSKQLSLFAP